MQCQLRQKINYYRSKGWHQRADRLEERKNQDDKDINKRTRG